MTSQWLIDQLWKEMTLELRKISNLLYQLKIANQEMTSLFEKDTGFSLTRYELMRILLSKGECSQSQLQLELKIDSAAITRHLKLLEEKAYVSRERNKDNNREVVVRATAKAKDDLARCDKAHDSAESSLDIGLSEEEEAQLLSLLSKLTTKNIK